MTPIVSVFAASPDRGRGIARDMAVRWALAEVGQGHELRPLSFAELKTPEHKARQPFGQIPTYESDGLTLFESGAIVLHIAESHPGLLPANPAARARAIAWMFAAVSTIEPVIVEREVAVLLEGDKPWTAERLPMLEARLRQRLDDLAAWLGDKDWLEGDFGAADIMMVCVLRRPASAMLLSDYPQLAAYLARAEARPAFQTAFADQKARSDAAHG
ncbi:glutathione S-transferase family protein [Sandarakinorhabdus limnophila]|uniref:glutathione S-transferase family protein n=1 Tax=Sandarakinorhabdus limnophila TaxID=210512 RepID=UPI0026F2D143|nr:glutathione S-transferase family protein [Sandarakinorhabdus limnophila]MCM0032025.1 glutathione S-transferase family protein [Sandarakinorhabdus limnophila]